MFRSLASLLVVAACGSAEKPVVPAKAACPTAPITIAGPEEVAAIAHCPALPGVTLKTAAKLELGALVVTRIDGDLALGPTFGVEELPMRELREVTGALRVTSNADLRGIYLPKLERAGSIEIASNASLTTISAGKLAAVAGSVVIEGNTGLEMVDLSLLATVGDSFALVDNSALSVLEVGAFASAKAVRIENARALDPAIADALRAKAGSEASGSGASSGAAAP